jgi:hypothetical protein
MMQLDRATAYEAFIKAVDARIEHYGACELCQKTWSEGHARRDYCVFYARLSENVETTMDWWLAT